MTDHTNHPDTSDVHALRPAFRAKLERDIVDAFRRESKLAPASRWAPPWAPPWRATSWMRTAAAVVFGAFLASGTGFAAAQVQDAQQRGELTEALAARLQLAQLRLELAEARMKQVRERADAGVASRDQIAAAETELVAMNAALRRLQLELAEVRATAAAPREELWAPRVNEQDFVTQRLAVELEAARQAAAVRERAVEEIARQVRVGALAESALTQARLDALTARQALDMLGTKLALRREFLEQGLSPETIARRVQRFEVISALARAQEQMRGAQERLSTAQQRTARGAGDRLDVLRADLELQELQLALRALQRELAALEAAGRR